MIRLMLTEIRAVPAREWLRAIVDAVAMVVIVAALAVACAAFVPLPQPV